MHCPGCSAVVKTSGRFCINCGYDFAAMPGFFDSRLLPVGFVLDRRYRVLDYVTSGGMANVYRVEDNRLKNVYALKEMIDNFKLPEDRQDAVHRFSREAEILARLTHPSIPHIIDHFVENQRYYLVMEYIEGKDLETALNQKPDKRFSLEEVLPWLNCILEVLEYLHGHTPPVIYRDLKPSNIILGDNGRIYLIDFGIARIFTPRKKGTLIGTPGYAPPEQYKGRVDTRSDIYGLGATLHHLVSGRDPREDVPFNFPPLKTFIPDVNEYFASLVEKALSYEVEDRFKTVAEMKEALRFMEEAKEGKMWYKRGLSLLKSGEYLEAEKAMDKALSTDPQDVSCLINRGVVRERLGKVTEAMEDFKAACGLAPGNPEAAYNLGCAYKKADNPEKARECFEAVIGLAPDHSSAYNNLGNLYFLEKRWDRAAELYEKALFADPGFDLARENLEKAQRKKEAEERIKQFDQAVRFDSDPARAFYNLGMYFMEWNRLEEAEGEFQKALKLRNDDPDPHEGLGLLYERKGDFSAARRHLESALKLDPDRLTLYAPLVRSYLKMGNNTEARACLDAGMERIAAVDENWRNNKDLAELTTLYEKASGSPFDPDKWEKSRKSGKGTRTIKDALALFFKTMRNG